MNLKRHNNHWTPNELERMYREYNLRELTIQEIADLHGRTTYAILNKLVQENLINENWADVKGWTPEYEYEKKEQDEEEEDEEEEEEEEEEDEEDEEDEDEEKEDEDEEDEEDEEEEEEEQEEDEDDSSDYDPEQDEVEQEEDQDDDDDGNVPYNMEIYNIGVATRGFLRLIHYTVVGVFHFIRKNIVPLFNK
uniref:Uncharacterized protein n=1 Tax=viral metagenome TaxID=1070528 RepID=A0A6C0LFT3_9ZZZZ